jgi:hypothetical protein
LEAASHLVEANHAVVNRWVVEKNVNKICLNKNL